MTTNPNIEWSRTFVQELAAAGLRAVCLAPGSRSTPLTLAFDRHPGVAVHVHMDERCAAFAALGMALKTDRPVALVCTSGTAAAEFYAAIIEARQSHVPLLVLTSDRPHELRHSGANQTIDQVKLYGDHVLWSVDAALPDAAAPAVALRNLRTLAARAYARADGTTKGPVHVNFPFRKPLEPATLASLETDLLSAPTTRISRGIIVPDQTQVDEVAASIRAHRRGLIICGPRTPGGDFPAAVAALARAAGYPLLADPLSGVRYGPQVEGTPVISSYETILKPRVSPLENPELVIRFGAVPTSKWLNDYLIRTRPQTHIHVRANGVWADEAHLVTDFLQVDEAALCRAVTTRIDPARPSNWLDAFTDADCLAADLTRSYCAGHDFDAAFVRAVVSALPAGANLFVGNSLPIRHVDQFVTASPVPLHVYANRGASGIDGTVSTALGLAAADPAHPLVFLTGDVAFYHDLNGLLALRQQGLQNVLIVLLNNDGGGIFRRLPVAALEPAFTSLFVTPHGLDFSHAAAMYGLSHVRAVSPADLAERVGAAIAQPQPTLLEVITDSNEDLAHQRALTRQIEAALAVSPAAVAKAG